MAEEGISIVAECPMTLAAVAKPRLAYNQTQTVNKK